MNWNRITISNDNNDSIADNTICNGNDKNDKNDQTPNFTEIPSPQISWYYDYSQVKEAKNNP